MPVQKLDLKSKSSPAPKPQPVLPIGTFTPSPILLDELTHRVIGQSEAIGEVVNIYRVWRAALHSPNRPIGSFVFLGPTGTGKTHLVESLAEVLHGSTSRRLRVDCGEFQMDHETAKLMGAPPGYLGHRETKPLLGQAQIDSVRSEACPISLVLFDEIEKASPALVRLLLGVLDRGVLRMGDASETLFNTCMVFMTSNLGAAEIQRKLSPEFGFASPTPQVSTALFQVTGAARRHFPPEFFNRVDKLVTFQPLSSASLERVLDLELGKVQDRINSALGSSAVILHTTADARAALLEEGTDQRYGARQLKRVIEQRITYPLAEMIENGLGSDPTVQLDHSSTGYHLITIGHSTTA